MNKDKSTVTREDIKKLAEQPCTIMEVVKISRAVASDMVNGAIDDYRRRSTSTIVALTLQLEVLKRLVVERGFATLDELQSMYEEEAKKFDEDQKAFIDSLNESSKEEAPTEEYKPTDTVDLGTKAHPVEVHVERRGE